MIRWRGLVVLSLLAGACRTGNGGDSAHAPVEGEVAAADLEGLPTTYPGTLVDIGTIERNFLMRQKLSGSWQEMKFSFEAVVQKMGDKLTVIGMTPFGTKAFVLEQTGTSVKFEKFVDRDMPFPPEYILQDIHRVFLYDAELPWGARGQPGANEAEVHEERVRDRFEGAGLVARSFARSSGDPAGEITVEYGGEGMVDAAPPKRISFLNGWFGYRLEIKTVEYQPL